MSEPLQAVPASTINAAVTTVYGTPTRTGEYCFVSSTENATGCMKQHPTAVDYCCTHGIVVLCGYHSFVFLTTPSLSSSLSSFSRLSPEAAHVKTRGAASCHLPVTIKTIVYSRKRKSYTAVPGAQTPSPHACTTPHQQALSTYIYRSVSVNARGYLTGKQAPPVHYEPWKAWHVRQGKPSQADAKKDKPQQQYHML